MAGQSTTVVVVDQQPVRILGPPEGHRDWSTGLCDCFEHGSATDCIFGYFCTICVMVRNSTRLKESCFLPFGDPGKYAALRTKLRTLGGIRGNIGNDNCIICLCPALATCQMARELDYMGL